MFINLSLIHEKLYYIYLFASKGDVEHENMYVYTKENRNFKIKL